MAFFYNPPDMRVFVYFEPVSVCNFASKKAAKWTFFVFVGPMSHHFQVLQKNFRSLFVYTTRRLPLRPQRQCLLLNSHTNSFLEIKAFHSEEKKECLTATSLTQPKTPTDQTSNRMTLKPDV